MDGEAEQQHTLLALRCRICETHPTKIWGREAPLCPPPAARCLLPGQSRPSEKLETSEWRRGLRHWRGVSRICHYHRMSLKGTAVTAL